VGLDAAVASALVQVFRHVRRLQRLEERAIPALLEGDEAGEVAARVLLEPEVRVRERIYRRISRVCCR